jgi:hypothetical protein
MNPIAYGTRTPQRSTRAGSSSTQAIEVECAGKGDSRAPTIAAHLHVRTLDAHRPSERIRAA